jgi:UDP:flavonoid glycosyltransferase YjiC (YdhE family)
VQGLDVEVIASVGRGGVRFSAPDNVRVVEWIELSEMLSTATAVVCHGGSGTALATLAAGIPMVVIPLIADQPTNATMVEALGAGIAIRTSEEDAPRGLTSADSARVPSALEAVLTDGSYAEAARAAARQLGSRATVAEALDSLR